MQVQVKKLNDRATLPSSGSACAAPDSASAASEPPELAAAGSAVLNETATVNTEPSPFVEATEMRPPIISTMFFEIAIPSPVP